MMITWLRSLLFIIVQVIITIPYATVCLLALPLPWRIRYAIAIGWPKLFAYLAKWILGIKWHLEGWENIPTDPTQAFIVLSKHQSAWETIFLAAMLPRPVSFIYKHELNWIPFFGWALSTLDMISINRKLRRNALEQLLDIGAQHLNRGRIVVLFPEGTRVAPGQVGNYKSGGAKLAVSTQTPIIPIALNAGELWPRNSFIKKAGTVSVVVGAPVFPQGKNFTELNQDVQNWIEEKMKGLNPERY